MIVMHHLLVYLFFGYICCLAATLSCRATPGSIAELLTSIDASKHLPTFEREELELADLPHLTDDNWRELKFPIGPRARLRRYIQACEIDQKNVDGDSDNQHNNGADDSGAKHVEDAIMDEPERSEDSTAVVVDELPPLEDNIEEDVHVYADGLIDADPVLPIPAAKPEAEPQTEGGIVTSSSTKAQIDGWWSWVLNAVGWGTSRPGTDASGAQRAVSRSVSRGCSFDRMISWIRANGGKVDPRVYVSSSREGDRGVHVSERVDKGDWLMSVPMELMIMSAEDLGQQFEELFANSPEDNERAMWVQEVKVGVQLLVERQRILLGKGSAFAPYIDCLPPPTFCTLPLCASRAELASLGDADIATFTNVIDKLARAHRMLRWPAELAANPPSLQEFIWAVATVTSRAARVHVDGARRPQKLAMLPLLDMMNHAPSPRGSPFLAHPELEGHTVKRTEAVLTKGEEVFGQYAFDRSCRDMLLLFGFVPADTRENKASQFYEMQTHVVYGDADQRRRAYDLLQDFAKPGAQGGKGLVVTEVPSGVQYALEVEFRFERNNIPSSTLALFRFLSAQTSMVLTSSTQLMEQISPELERNALQLMRQALDSTKIEDNEVSLRAQLDDARAVAAHAWKARGDHGAADIVNANEAKLDASAAAAHRQVMLLKFRLFRWLLVKSMRAQIDNALDALQ